MAATAGIVSVLVWHFTRPSADELVSAAREALKQGQLEKARVLSAKAVARAPRSTAVRLAAADVELQSSRFESALQHLAAIGDEGAATLHAVSLQGEALYRLKRLSEAEKCFRRVIELDPRNLPVRERLASLLAISGRREAAHVLLEIVKGGQFSVFDLTLLGDPEQIYRDPDFEKLLEEPLSGDPGLLLAIARLTLLRHNSSRAAGLYRELAAKDPADLDVQAGLGRALVEADTTDEFLRWHARLPQEADEHPEIWSVRGRFAQKRSEDEMAIRCYGEALRRDPNQKQTNYQMALLLHKLGDDNRARAFQQRAEQLTALMETLGSIFASENPTELWLRAAQLTEALGRPREAWGWYGMAVTKANRQEFRSDYQRLAAALKATTPQTLPGANPATNFDLTSWPLPALSEGSPRPELPPAGGSPWIGGVTFADLARDAKVSFTYHNGYDPAVGMRIFEDLGGGVAALDYDGDLWPDLYFTQACDWPPQAGQVEHLDRLFRNLGNGTFADVTAASGVGDERFSHGIAAGDVDDDGFPDLYVANIGENRLYRNNGDGTFTDGTAGARLEGSAWTTSALIADLNGDGFPEIYDVTYLAGREPFEHICHDGKTPMACAPTIFAADEDRLYLNRGDGTFEDISAPARIRTPNGKGLGIVAGDFDGSGRLSLYVANDTTDNFLFLNQPRPAGDLPVFIEQGKLSGCAVNGEGLATASMGIAVDDADGDGRLDLFVTTFYLEYNVLYRQLPGGMFEDVSGTTGLKEPSLLKLGFGTQFLDADLDGCPDLVAANGHTDDLRRRGIPYRMRAQLFANTGGGRFVELPPEQAGDYFQREELGRGLARLDWDRDGREDFAVSNLDTPAALVTNRSVETGHFLALQLRGVQSNRDAIGTKVEATCGGRKLFKQMTAGDGYQASNERQLVIGLGSNTIVEELLVHWPSGRMQRFTQLSGDSQYLLVEGRPDLVRLRSP